MARSRTSPKNNDLMLGAGLVVAVILAYIPVWWAGFAWDDALVLTNNPVVTAPLGIIDLWTTKAADICPLTLSTFWLEYKLWGAVPWPYHLVNVAVHAGSAVLLWRVLLRLGAPGAWLGAAIWALHPVEVESVAWISELKNTQSGLFYLASILFFLRGTTPPAKASRPGWDWLLTILFGLLAFTSKSSTVVLPLVLVLCWWWRRDNWNWRAWAPIAALFAGAIIAAAVSVWIQHAQPIPAARVELTFAERLVTAGYAIWFYLGKLLLPMPLLTVYPGWDVTPRWNSLLPLLALFLVPVFAWQGWKTWGRPCLFTFGYFVLALLPVLNLVTSNCSVFSPVADHFQYLASMGPLALLGAGLASLKAPAVRKAAGSVTVCVCTAATCLQATFFRDDETLWRHTLSWNPDCWIGLANLGFVFDKRGEREAAIEKYRRSLALNPTYEVARYNLGYALYREGRLDEALAQVREASVLKADDPNPIALTATILQAKGQFPEAIDAFQRAIVLRPNSAEYHFDLGNALLKTGRVADAVGEYRDAIRLNPDYADPHNSLGFVFAQQGDFPAAVTEFEEALRIQPDLEMARRNLAQAQALLQQATKP